ncbi:hypothetical protein BS50DRAFT_635326 [Corynespora cassiicola Philippines]|uniref:Uncharacterized protein n=1 Tax=Corynespora cassiicola Philippines TaxID=1448308 RepID=A0A2T2NL64_CORCC|nr:hypothetical protein BS50DRAFT_635326 [Corynespora cassiicola Philippines]
METISNITSAASKAIWGEQKATGNETAGQEPISGQQGKGTVNDPFDKGNSENPTTTSSNDTTTVPNTSTSTSTPATNMSATADPVPKDTATSAPTNLNSAATGGVPKPLEETEKTGVTGSLGDPVKGSDVIPSNSAHPGVTPDSGAIPAQKQQGADRPQETPIEAVKEEKKAPGKSIDDRTEEDFAKTRDPNDHSGEPLRMHDGSEKPIPNTHDERRTSKAGLPGGVPHGKELGSGEEWIKTSGLHADGGDFDATKPGAGREADRLLEEKGVKKVPSRKSEDAAPSTTSGASGDSSDKKEKVPLGEKIKTKLHIGHKDNISQQLYTSGYRFLYEIVQNSDDSSLQNARNASIEPFLWFKITPGFLSVETNEDGFTQKDVEAICATGKSSKKATLDDENTGEKGFGFKSVFSVAHEVHVQSGIWPFRFQHHQGENGMGMVIPLDAPMEELRDGVTIKITLSLTDLPTTGYEKLLKAVNDMPDTTVFSSKG